MNILHWSKIAGKFAFHASRDTKTPRRPVPYHGHDFAEVFWIDAGHGTHRVNGAAIPVQPGNVVLIRPPDFHGIEVTGPGELRLTNIAFPREIFDFLHDRYFTKGGCPFSLTQKIPEMRQAEPAQLRRFNGWADELSRSPREPLYIERFLLNIMAELSLRQNDPLPENAPDWLTAACQAMQKPENFSRGVEIFLRLCGRSREHATRTVRQVLGLTPTDYVNRIRMEYAKRQLEMGDQGILEIAGDCGIHNLSHFYSLFRHYTGATPRHYRLAHRKPL